MQDAAGLLSGPRDRGTGLHGAHPPGAPPQPHQQNHLGSNQEEHSWQSQTEHPGGFLAEVFSGVSARMAGGSEEKTKGADQSPDLSASPQMCVPPLPPLPPKDKF